MWNQTRKRFADHLSMTTQDCSRNLTQQSPVLTDTLIYQPCRLQIGGIPTNVSEQQWCFSHFRILICSNCFGQTLMALKRFLYRVLIRPFDGTRSWVWCTLSLKIFHNWEFCVFTRRTSPVGITAMISGIVAFMAITIGVVVYSWYLHQSKNPVFRESGQEIELM